MSGTDKEPSKQTSIYQTYFELSSTKLLTTPVYLCLFCAALPPIHPPLKVLMVILISIPGFASLHFVHKSIQKTSLTETNDLPLYSTFS